MDFQMMCFILGTQMKLIDLVVFTDCTRILIYLNKCSLETQYCS